MQDEAWKEYNAKWVDDRFKVRNYLQIVWEEENYTIRLPYTLEKMKETAKYILEVSKFFLIAML